MSAATLDQIEDALYTALNTLAPTGTNPRFKTVGRFAGEVTATLGVDADTLGRSPAALLALEGEDPDDKQEIDTLLLGPVQLVGRSLWRVYIIVEDPRGTTPAIKGTVGLPGVLSLAQSVITTLAGLQIPGLYSDQTVKYMGLRPVWIDRGSAYVYMARFSAERSIDLVPIADTSVPLTEIVGNEHLTDALPGVPDPLVSFQAP